MSYPVTTVNAYVPKIIRQDLVLHDVNSVGLVIKPQHQTKFEK